MKKNIIACLVAVLALAAVGAGFAMWSDTVGFSATAETGSLQFEFVPNSSFSRDGVSTPDYTCGPWIQNPSLAPEGKDVGATTTAITQSSQNGPLDTLTVSVSNAYPCYYNDISWNVKNSGTIPVIIQQAKLLWGKDSLGNPVEFPIDAAKTYALCKNGPNQYSIMEINMTNPPSDPDQFYFDNNVIFEFSWGDNVGLQLHPGEEIEQSFKFHVVQPAEQSMTGANAYTFSLQIDGVQWNESPIAGHRP